MEIESRDASLLHNAVKQQESSAMVFMLKW